MASRLIHYLIAEEISKINNQINRDRFVYGSLLPDLSFHEDGSYNRAHYGEISKELKGINWLKFRDKYYLNMIKDALYLGYYCHLIMDAFWFSKIADKYIRIHPYPERNIYYQKSYKDYRILNYLLSKKYDLKYHILIIDTDIEEINLSLRDNFFQGLKEEITNPDTAYKKELKLYPYDVILEYIEQARDLCINELKAFKEGKDFINPSIFYRK